MQVHGTSNKEIQVSFKKVGIYDLTGSYLVKNPIKYFLYIWHLSLANKRLYTYKRPIEFTQNTFKVQAT